MSSLRSYYAFDNVLTTTNATVTTILNYTMEPDSVTHARCRVVGRRQSNGHGFFAEFEILIRRVGSGSNGTTTIGGPIELLTTVKDGLDMLTTGYNYWVNTDNFTVDVTGLAGVNIDWFAEVSFMIN